MYFGIVFMPFYGGYSHARRTECTKMFEQSVDFKLNSTDWVYLLIRSNCSNTEPIGWQIFAHSVVGSFAHKGVTHVSQLKNFFIIFFKYLSSFLKLYSFSKRVNTLFSQKSKKKITRKTVGMIIETTFFVYFNCVKIRCKLWSKVFVWSWKIYQQPLQLTDFCLKTSHKMYQKWPCSISWCSLVAYWQEVHLILPQENN